MKRWIGALGHLAMCMMALAILLSPLTPALAEDLALEQAKICAFSVEYGDGGGQVHKWTDPIRVYFSGNYTKEDLAFFYQFIQDMSENVPNCPPISLVNRKEDANVCFYYVRLKEMGTYISGYTEGNWGYFTFWWNGSGDINRMDIGIAYDKTNQKERNHLAMEEFIGGLGLTNDHYLDQKSILYQGWTTVQQPTDADWRMMRMLYDPRIVSGMTKEAALSVMATVQ